MSGQFIRFDANTDQDTPIADVTVITARWYPVPYELQHRTAHQLSHRTHCIMLVNVGKTSNMFF